MAEDIIKVFLALVALLVHSIFWCTCYRHISAEVRLWPFSPVHCPGGTEVVYQVQLVVCVSARVCVCLCVHELGTYCSRCVSVDCRVV